MKSTIEVTVPMKRLLLIEKELNKLFDAITQLQQQFEYKEEKIFRLLKEEEKLKAKLVELG